MSTHVSMHDLLESGAHFGHQGRYGNPKMRPYIYGTLRNIHIINLQYTLPALRRAQAKARDLGRNRNKLLFVGTKRASREHIKQAALSIGQPYANQRWLGGMLTNYKTIRASIKVYNDLKTQFEDGTTQKLTKKEVLLRQRKLDKLERSIGGIKEMGGLPDAVFIVDIDREHIAVTETSSLGIPIMAMVDTNCDPDKVDYVIPINDDSSKTIKLIVDAIAAAYAEGLREADQLNPVVLKGPKVTTAKERRKTPTRVKRSAEVAAEAAVSQPESVTESAATVRQPESAAEPVVVASETQATPEAVAEVTTSEVKATPEAESATTTGEKKAPPEAESETTTSEEKAPPEPEKSEQPSEDSSTENGATKA